MSAGECSLKNRYCAARLQTHLPANEKKSPLGGFIPASERGNESEELRSHFIVVRSEKPASDRGVGPHFQQLGRGDVKSKPQIVSRGGPPDRRGIDGFEACPERGNDRRALQLPLLKAEEDSRPP